MTNLQLMLELKMLQEVAITVLWGLSPFAMLALIWRLLRGW